MVHTGWRNSGIAGRGRRANRSGDDKIVAGEAAEAGGPGEGSLDRPAPRPQHKAALDFGTFHDDQADTARRRFARRRLAGIALIDTGSRDTLTGGRRHRRGEPADLCPVLLVGRYEVGRQKVTHRIDRQVQL